MSVAYSDYIYIPIANNCQLIKNSINKHHFQQMIHILNRREDIRQWSYTQIPHLFKTVFQTYICHGKSYPFDELFTDEIRDGSAFIEIEPIEDSFIVGMKKAYDNIYQRQPMRDIPLRSIHQPLMVAGAYNLNDYQYLTAIIGGLMLLLFFSQGPLSKKIFSLPGKYIESADTLFSDNDERRLVIGIHLIDIGKSICLKLTNNPQYLDTYLIEAKIYHSFRREYEKASDKTYLEHIAQYYGSDHVPIKDNCIDVQLTLYDGYSYRIAMDIRNIKLYNSKPVFYTCTEFFNRYITLSNADDPRIISAGFSKICYILGNLNQNYHFYHGDLHGDNILITPDAMDCKFFDFDFSGILTKIKNNTVFDSYGMYSNKRKQLLDLYDKNDIVYKDFLFIFDIYRLYLSQMIENTHRLNHHDEPPDIISNGDVSFTILDLHNAIQNTPGMLHIVGKRNKNVVYLMEYIKNNYLIPGEGDVFNYYFCNLNSIYLYIYLYIIRNNDLPQTLQIKGIQPMRFKFR